MNFNKFKLITGLSLILGIIFMFVLVNKLQSQNEGQLEKAWSSGSTYPMQFVDSCGRKITIKTEPKRIISAAPNITETLCALGAENKLVGKTEYCDYPETVKTVSSIGNLINPDMEKIIDLNPDVIIAADHFPKNTVEVLESLGINIVILKPNYSMNGTYDMIHRIGKIINHSIEANELIASMRAKIEDIRTKINTGYVTRPSIYYVIGIADQGSYTAGGETFISNLIELAGGVNSAKEAANWQYSLEKLIDAQPDIIICSKYYDIKQTIKSSVGYGYLDAVKNDQIYEIDNNLIDRQGPRIPEGFSKLAKIIHPKKFN